MNWSGVLISGAIGGLVALAIGRCIFWLHRRTVSKFPNTDSTGSQNLEQKRELVLVGDFDDVFASCREATGAIRRSTIRKEEKAVGRIDAVVGVSFRSYGEKITIIVRPVSSSVTSVSVSSEQRFSIAAVDYGKSFENVESVTRFLQARYGPG